MKRLIALLLCIFLTVPFIPASAEVEDWVADINGISAKVLEWCMQEHNTEMTLTLPASATRGMSDSEIWSAVYDALDEYCSDDYKVSSSSASDGGMKLRIRNIALRPGLLMAEAYWNGKTDRLNAEEKRCLRELESIVDGFVRKTGWNTVATELAIYDFICDRVEYRSYPSGDSRRKQCTSAANAYLYGWGNCQAYADLFFLMTMISGFDSGFVSGQGNGGAHIWNTISIGDDLLMVDVTYGDNPCENYPGPRHYYFNFGMDRKDRHTWSPQVMNPNYLAGKTNDKYSYYANKGPQAGGVFKKLSDAAKFCVKQVKNGKKYVEFLIPGKKVPLDDVHAAIKKALGRTQGQWYAYCDYMDGNTLIRFNWQEYKKRKVR